VDNIIKRDPYMASVSITSPEESKTERAEVHSLTMPEAARLLSREERFMATVAAMNTLLIEKEIYTQQEFDEIFCNWAQAQISKPKPQRPGWRSKFLSFLGR